MKKMVEVYVSLVNKLLDFIVKLFGKCDFIVKILNNKIFRKIAPVIALAKLIAFFAIIVYFLRRKKCKCKKK